MAITVHIPTPLRTLTGGADEVETSGATVGAVIENLESAHPGIKDRLCDEKGVRRFVNIFLNEDEDIRFLDNLDTELRDGDALVVTVADSDRGDWVQWRRDSENRTLRAADVSLARWLPWIAEAASSFDQPSCEQTVVREGAGFFDAGTIHV